ncbi:hypothetical protein ACTWQH_32075, partial [Streptomyces sp. 6N223]
GVGGRGSGGGAPGTALVLRVPAWAKGATVQVNDGPAEDTAPGWLRLERTWAPGDRVVLDLPLRPRAVRSHPYLDATRGSLALLRGPLVYCVEQQDAGAPVDDLVLSRTDLGAVGEATDDASFGVPIPVLATTLAAVPPPRGELYPEVSLDPVPAAPGRVPVRLVPYFLWGNRQPGAMRVWLRQF